MNENKRTIVIGMLRNKRYGKEQNRRVYDIQGIAPRLQSMQGGNRQPKVIVHERGQETDSGV